MDHRIIWLVVLIIFSAFFSLSEIALVSLSRMKIQQMVDKKIKNAGTIKKLRDNTHKLLITILIGNNLVNIWASVLAVLIGTDFFVSIGLNLTDSQIGGIITGVSTFIILVFGEIFPKTLATSNPEKFALLVAPIMKVLVIIFTPISWLLDNINKFFFFILKIKEEKKPAITEEDLSHYIATGAKEGSIKESEKVKIHNIFMFDDIEVRDVMCIKKDMIYINIDFSLEQIIKVVTETEYSRIPVYKTSKENIIGVLHTKELLPLIANKEGFELKNILSPTLFVREDKKIDKVFRLMQRKKIHIAIVVDTFSSIVGLITLEDLIEEIFGEIYDESDETKELIKKISDKEFIVEGAAMLEEVNEMLSLKMELKEHFITIAGFITDKLGRLPKNGEIIQVDNAEIIIKKVSKKGISNMHIIKK